MPLAVLKKSTKEVLKEALYYKKLNNTVQCQLCPRYCMIKPNERGNCGVRENKSGKLYSLVYGRPCAVEIDPIEKKPLFHFLPGQGALSIATAGCNFHCKFCQNWTISQAKPEEVPWIELAPEQLIDQAISSGCRIISYTYTEPTIFYEYMLDCAKLARQAGLLNTEVSNGFINLEPLKELCKWMDGANIDFKGPDSLYKQLSAAWRKPVEEAIKLMHEKGVWIELTNLLIPGYNDKEKDIKEVIAWVKGNLGLDVPLHFTAFYPAYKMLNTPATPASTVLKARQLALKAGLHYVYAGNILEEEAMSTYCPSCKKPLITRSAFYLKENKLVKGKCPYCNERIPGRWE